MVMKPGSSSNKPGTGPAKTGKQPAETWTAAQEVKADRDFRHAEREELFARITGKALPFLYKERVSSGGDKRFKCNDMAYKCTVSISIFVC